MRVPYGKSMQEFERLYAIESDDCTIWPYGKSRQGYGNIRHSGSTHLTHALSCEKTYGPRPPKHEAAHSCNVRSCINPRHLRWATCSENQMDRVAADTHARGERNVHAKLTEFDVRAIRHYVKCGTRQRVLADHFNISNQHISAIVSYKEWSWMA